MAINSKKIQMPHANELDKPDVVEQDERALELMRVWVAQGAQHVSIRGETWEDPGAWGTDFGPTERCRPCADSAGFDAEWGSPTDEPVGAL